MSASLDSIAEEYFNSLNHLARRISADIQVKREAYEEVWKSLSRKEQRQVMDETIIHPEAVLKYAAYPQDNPDFEYFPKLRLQTGEKYVVDEEGGKGLSLSWRDEHSAPFSWMTQSQLNLSVFCNKAGSTETAPPAKPKLKPSPPKRMSKPLEHFEPPSIVLGGSSLKSNSIPSKPKSPSDKDSNKSAIPEETFLTKLRSKTAVLKLPPKGKSSKSSRSESENLVRPGSSVIKIKPKTVIAKPKTPPPPPPPKQKKEGRTMETKEVDRKSVEAWEESAHCGAPEEEMALLTRLNEDEIDKPTKVDNNQEIKAQPYSEIARKVSKALSIPPSDSTDLLATFNVDLTNPSKDIPKTGFEFLDNW